MNKKLFFFLFLFLIFPKFIWAEILPFEEPYCENKLSQSNLINLYKVKIKDIEVKIIKDRKWKKNSLRIFIGNFRFIPDIHLSNTKLSKTNSIKFNSDEYFIKDKEMKNLGN